MSNSSILLSIPGKTVDGDFLRYDVPQSLGFSTWDPANAGPMTLSNDNLTVTGGGVAGGCYALAPKSSGKFYWEVLISGVVGFGDRVGFGIESATQYPQYSIGDLATTYAYDVWDGSSTFNNGTAITLGENMWAGTGEIINIALDLDTGKCWFGTNGNWPAADDPATGVSTQYVLAANSYMPAITAFNTNAVYTANFGDSPMLYTAPVGFTSGWPQ